MCVCEFRVKIISFVSCMCVLALQRYPLTSSCQVDDEFFNISDCLFRVYVALNVERALSLNLTMEQLNSVVAEINYA